MKLSSEESFPPSPREDQHSLIQQQSLTQRLQQPQQQLQPLPQPQQQLNKYLQSQRDLKQPGKDLIFNIFLYAAYSPFRQKINFEIR